MSAVDRELDRIVPQIRGIRKCAPSASPNEQSNMRAKERFDEAIEAAGLGGESVRDLALFFGVKKSTLYERVSKRRRDLAPLPEWFEKLARYAEWQQLTDEFMRSA